MNEDDDAAAASRRLADALREEDSTAVKALLDVEFRSVDRAGAETRGEAALGTLELGPAAARVQDYGEVTLLTGRDPVEGGERVVLETWVRRGDGWRLLVRQLNVIAAPDAPSGRPPHAARPAHAQPARCENPCEFVPYEPRDETERGIIESFQTLERHVVRNDSDQWLRHVAEEFVVYRTGQHPTTRAERIGHMREQKAINAEVHVAAVESMTIWVFGDTAIMRADHVMPGNRRPPYRATRVWVNRDGMWQMAVSQQTNRAA